MDGSGLAMLLAKLFCIMGEFVLLLAVAPFGLLSVARLLQTWVTGQFGNHFCCLVNN